MKHIFTIHSHITYLAALGAIGYEKLDDIEVVIICNAGYDPILPKNFHCKVVPTLDRMPQEAGKLNKLKPFGYSKNAISYIKKVSEGSDYVAYIDLMSAFNKYLILNERCVRFNMLEEGMINYGNFYDLNLLTADLRSYAWYWSGMKNIKELGQAIFRLYRGRSIRMQALPVHPNIYANFPNVNSYCFSELAFPGTLPQRRKLLHFTNMPELEGYEVSFPEGSWFWIGDILASQYKISMEHFREALERLLSKINPEKEKRAIYLKFRGPESEEEKQITRQMLESYGYTIHPVSSEVILELTFAKGCDFKVCGIASSLLLYANHFGHRTYSTLPYIPNIYGVSVHQAYPTVAERIFYAEN